MNILTHGHAPEQQEFPPRITIASADFGGPVRSIFDRVGLSELEASRVETAWLDGKGEPEDVSAAISAVAIVAGDLEARFARDGHALCFPGAIYLAPVSPVRRLAFLDVAIADLTRLRAWFAAQDAATAAPTDARPRPFASA